ERRAAQFTELVATAIANADARSAVRQLADEQAALRRVATLVAEGAPAPEIFNAVIEQVAELLKIEQVAMVRVERSGEVSVIAHRGLDTDLVRIGTRAPIAGDSVTVRVLRSGRSARINLSSEGHGPIAELGLRTGIAASVGAPITVEGAVWGV